MDYLKKKPEMLYNYYNLILRDNSYNCFNELINYNINIEPFYHYLNCIDMHKLKNVWNYIISRWITMHQSLRENNKYKKSIYSKKNHRYIHSMIDDKKLDELLHHFIQNDITLQLFVANCILSFSLP